MKKTDAKPLDWTAQLVMLRGMTERFQSLHEAQKLQLQLWPFVVDTSLANTKANVDMEAKTVQFVWTGSSMKIGPKYNQRLKVLDDSVKFLLGNDWTVTVWRDGTLIYPVDTKNAKPGRKRGNSKKRRRARAGRKQRR